MLLCAIGFNLWTYRMEPTALTDPNDNTFQFALVDRTNQVWDFAVKTCSGITKPFCVASYLTDHWVPNWAEGYNLPYYYSHLPQITIVTSFRFLSFILSTVNRELFTLFQYYHWVIYLLLCFFPLSVFVALRTIRLTPIIAGIGALVSSHLSTDGLYGLDPTSFLWRGYGLSSQLFAMVWLPLALANAYVYFIRDRDKKQTLIDALLLILFLALTTAGHLGIGIIAFLCVGFIAISPFIQAILTQRWSKKELQHIAILLIQCVTVFGIVGLLLGYWIVPILKDGAYHNISVWDGIWKFDSFGYREVLTHLINGDLFDFGRAPVLTILVMIGLSAAINSTHFPFALLFIVWLLLYFGRTTWGGLFSLIPGMSEFHLSRFIVGVHIAGIFLIPIGIDWFITAISSYIPRTRQFVTVLLCQFVVLVVLVFLVFPQTIRYAAHNDFLIARGNQNFTKDEADISRLLVAVNRELKAHPGRVFAGRGGSWGKSFRIAETPMYMHLSTYGIPVVLWLPETWSPNSDTEQYFSEGNRAHYTLYNVRFVVTPIDLAREHIQPFWKLVESGKTWKMYAVETDGYITSGIKPAIVSSTKETYRNVVRLWMHSDYPGQYLYPELTFDADYPKPTGLPNFRMTDEASYIVPDGSLHSLFAEIPRYVSPIGSPSASPIVITTQSASDDMIFRATVNVGHSCTTACMVILRQTFHPSWQATVDGKEMKPFAVFPFFTAISVGSPGEHTVVFSYRPSYTKQVLLFIGFVMFGILMWVTYRAIVPTGKTQH